uniref:Deoxyribonuclease-1-like 1 n=1 Tax=Myripristis murdjan TaxID=586833 RepID=A0A667YZL2_9TELE
MRSLSFILLFLVWGVCGVQGATVFRICAFNIQSFGEGKASKTKVMHTIVRVRQTQRWIGSSIFAPCLEHLYDSAHEYDAVQSERLGRSDTYQEQYVFVYRTGTVTVTDQYQYPDTLKGDIDAFAREPFVVRFSAPKTALKDFVLIPLHTSPNNTTKELDAVVDVFNDIRKKWKTENVIFLGDFNADCGYLAKKNRKNVRLITDPAFIWLINDKNDTTVRKSTDCAYDRIVVHGEKVARAIVPLSAKPFNFKKEFRLSEDQALEVSDHYPVEVLLKASASRQQQVSLSLLLILLALTFNSITLYNKSHLSDRDLQLSAV